ncbi:hypothetical protein ACH4CE_30810 [Streptomyces gelaticus]|uniref:hypothetical protein n=1 Tax=Streptomyces gelaticus TaxID=285446 RepID=UPI00379429FF
MNATSPAGALLLCRAEPETVRPVAHLLRERMLLAPAGDGWSVLVPEGKPWQGGSGSGSGAVDVEPVDRIGLVLPPGMDPDTPGDRLYAAADRRTGTEPLVRTGCREVVRADPETVEGSRPGPWTRGPRAPVSAGAQLAAGLPLVLWGLRRRGGGWVLAGTLLLAHGALGLARDRIRDAEDARNGRE